MTRKRKKVDIRGFEVMPKPCATCPFVTNSIGAEATAPYLESLVTFQAQHLCHSANDSKICRGGRDIMLRAMTALGLIDQPTDEAFERTSRHHLGDKYIPPGTRPSRTRSSRKRR